jgi:hypothetical protein
MHDILNNKYFVKLTFRNGLVDYRGIQGNILVVTKVRIRGLLQRRKTFIIFKDLTELSRF